VKLLSGCRGRGITNLRPSATLGALFASCALFVFTERLSAQAGPAGEGDSASTPAGMVPNPPRGSAALATAVRISSDVSIDGVLDEPFWATIEPIRDFVQRDPVDGGMPSEWTEVRVAYDEENLYFGWTLNDRDPDGIRATILHRGGRIAYDDHINIGLDTFDDDKNGYIFEINSMGTQDDALFVDEGSMDWNWDGVYHSEGRVTEDGWFLEVAIPFKTIRFPRSEVLRMGLILRRTIPRKNETMYWPHLPATYRSNYSTASQYGTLIGIEGVSPGRNVNVKPYVLGGAQHIGVAAPTNSVTDAGLDVKWAVTPALTLDLTYNTDFAQVEADNVQINFERFSLFYPEKREFFLERSGIFTFGDAGQSQVFFSRRIGLANPIIGGGRLTGQIGRFTVGLLNLQTGEAAGAGGANNAVTRVRADLGRRGTIGGIVTNQQGDEWSRSAGADLQFRFLGSSSFEVWTARTWEETPASPAAEGEERGLAGGFGAAAINLNVRNARYGATAGYTNIGTDFAPALGFVRRPDQLRLNGELAFTPRFERSTWARQLNVTASASAIDGQDGVRQSSDRAVNASFNFQTGDSFGGSATRRFERLVNPYSVRQGAQVQPGDYIFSTVSFNLRSNATRKYSANTSLSTGEFYDGTRTQWNVGAAAAFSRHLSIATSVGRNWVDLPIENGTFTTTVVDFTVRAAVSRKLFADALFQYDDVSGRIQSNIRINWIHTPGSNLYLVFNSGYNTGDLLDPAQSRWESRTGVAKLTYLWAI